MAQILGNKAFFDRMPPHTPEALIDEMIAEDKPNDFFIIAPTGKIVRKLNYYYIRKYFELHSRPVGSPNFFTISKFVRYLFSRIYQGSKFRIVSDAFRFALFEEAANKAKLNYFRPKQGRLSQAVLEKLSRVIFGLKEDGIRPSDMKHDLENYSPGDPGIDPQKLGDLYELYTEYQHVLEGSTLDSPEALTKTVDYLTKNDWQLELFRGEEKIKEELFKDQVILFHGFSEFKKTEQELIGIFADSQIPLGIHIDYSTSNGPLFGNLEENITYLKSKGFHLSEDDTQLNAGISDFVRVNLFNHKSDAKSEALGEMISLFESDSLIEEVRNIASYVKYLIAEENYKPSQICICTRKIEKYSEIFREVFRQYRIPMNLSDRFALAQSPLINAIFSILNTISEEYKIEDVHKTLSSNYISMESDIDVTNLYEIARMNRISGGKRQGGKTYWLRAFEQRMQLLKNQIRDLERGVAQDAMQLFDKKTELNNTQKAYEDIKKVFKELPQIARSQSPSDFSRLLKAEIIKKFKIREKIIESYLAAKEEQYNNLVEKNYVFEDLERDSRALAELLKLLDELVFILEERYPKQSFPLDEYINKLKNTVIGAKYQISEKQGYGVEVTAIEQIRSIPYDITFICGMIDGDFPIAYSPEVFLGKVLESSEQKHLRSERIHFYQALTNNPEKLDFGTKKIILSYHKYSDEKELVPSHFISALLKIAPIEENGKIYYLSELKKVLSDGNAIENLPWLAYLNTEREIKKYYSRTTDKEAAKKIVREDVEFYSTEIIQYPDNLDFSSLNEREIAEIEKKSKNEISVSQLETFITCPYRYFAQRQLNLGDRAKIQTEMSPLEKGNLLHMTLHRFFSELKEDQLKRGVIDKINVHGKGQPIAMVVFEKDKYPEYLKKLNAIAREELEAISKYNPFYQFDMNDICGGNGTPGILKTWLDSEYNRIREGWEYQPAMFEFEFGDVSSNSPGAVEIAPNIRLKGKIDRIELKRNIDGTYSAVIADYKLNQGDGPLKLKLAKSLQLPLYAVAVKSLLQNHYHLSNDRVEGLYFKLTPKKDKNPWKSEQIVMISPENALYKQLGAGRSSAISTSFTLDDILDQAIGKASQVMDEITSGRISVDPDDKACDYCDYSSLCRISEKEESANIA